MQKQLNRQQQKVKGVQTTATPRKASHLGEEHKYKEPQPGALTQVHKHTQSKK
jgi:hypothetical protein